MKFGKILSLVLLALLVLGIWTVVVIEVYRTQYVVPTLAKNDQLMAQLASREASKAVDARLQKLMSAYEDGENGATYESPEAMFWWIGYHYKDLSGDQDRVFNSMEELFHRDKSIGAQWQRVHMAIDNKPSWQPKD